MRAGWVAALMFASACSAGPTTGLAGSVAYTDATTGNVRVHDLATAYDALIDPGQFGLVSIAPDAKHFIYAGADLFPKLADRSGNIHRLAVSSLGAPATWLSSTVATFSAGGDAILLPNLDGASRSMPSAVAVSQDLQQVAYVDELGNVCIEDLDGSNHRILSPSIDPTSMFPRETIIDFTPDARAVLVGDSTTTPTTLHIISIADGTSIDVPDAFVGGTPFGPLPRVLGASTFSSDGSEVLMQSTTALIAVSLATGAKRTIATFVPNESSGGGVFLDDQRVLWMRLDDHSMGDAGLIAVSLHVSGPSDDVLIEGPRDNAFTPTIVVLPDGFIATNTDAALVKTDGTVVVPNPSTGTDALVNDLLGPTPDGKGVIIASYLGVVRYLGIDGETRDILTTAKSSNTLAGPFAAYTPGR